MLKLFYHNPVAVLLKYRCKSNNIRKNQAVLEIYMYKYISIMLSQIPYLKIAAVLLSSSTLCFADLSPIGKSGPSLVSRIPHS